MILDPLDRKKVSVPWLRHFILVSHDAHKIGKDVFMRRFFFKVCYTKKWYIWIDKILGFIQRRSAAGIFSKEKEGVSEEITSLQLIWQLFKQVFKLGKEYASTNLQLVPIGSSSFGKNWRENFFRIPSDNSCKASTFLSSMIFPCKRFNIIYCSNLVFFKVHFDPRGAGRPEVSCNSSPQAICLYALYVI